MTFERRNVGRACAPGWSRKRVDAVVDCQTNMLSFGVMTDPAWESKCTLNPDWVIAETETRSLEKADDLTDCPGRGTVMGAPADEKVCSSLCPCWPGTRWTPVAVATRMLTAREGELEARAVADDT